MLVVPRPWVLEASHVGGIWRQPCQWPGVAPEPSLGWFCKGQGLYAPGVHWFCGLPCPPGLGREEGGGGGMPAQTGRVGGTVAEFSNFAFRDLLYISNLFPIFFKAS